MSVALNPMILSLNPLILRPNPMILPPQSNDSSPQFDDYPLNPMVLPSIRSRTAKVGFFSSEFGCLADFGCFGPGLMEFLLWPKAMWPHWALRSDMEYCFFAPSATFLK
jgi:hypothetical protein